MLASLTYIVLGFSVSWSACPSYDAISTPEARQLDPRAYAGFWYEVQSANVFLADGCHCTRYNWTLTSPTTFADTFTCHKGSASGSVTTLPNHGSFPASEPGKMVESLGPTSPPYWVLRLWGSAPSYDYSLVYACVGALGIKEEYIYLFSRNPTIPPEVLAEMHGHLSNHSISYADVKEVPMDGCECLALGCVGNALTLVWRLGDAWLARLPLFNMLMFMYVCIPFLVGFAIAHAAATETTYLHSKLSRVTTQLDEVQRLTRELENARRVSLLASATATATATSKQLEALEGATLLHLDAQSVDDSSDTCSELTEFTASPVVSRRNDLRPCVKMLLDGLEPTTGSIDLSVEQLYSAIPQFDLSDVDVRLTSAERQNLLLSVSASGDLTSAAGEPLNTHDDLANFVLLEDGSLYVSIKKLHHHQLAGCAPIVAAGEMTIHDGELRTITNGSGHYRPSPECLDVVLSVLRARGARVLPTLQVQKFTVTGSPLAPLD